MTKFVCLIILLMSPSAWAQSGPPSRLDRGVITWHPFYALPPKTLAASWELADVVILGTVLRADTPAPPTGWQRVPAKDVTTLSSIQVSEVFKGDLWPGSIIGVRDHAGTFETADAIVRSLDTTMTVGGRYVLFLKAGSMVATFEFRPHFGPAAVLGIRDEKVVPQGHAPLAKSLAGQSAATLISDLRRLRDSR